MRIIIFVIALSPLLIMPIMNLSSTNDRPIVWIDSNKNGIYDSGEWSGYLIRDAIENSSNNDIIHVNNETEDSFPIEIDKPLKLMGSSTIVDAKGSDKIFLIKSDNVLIENFVIKNSSMYGIYSNGFDNITVRNNLIINCGEGIGIYNSNLSSISENEIYDCMFGIFAGSSKNVGIHENLIMNSSLGIQSSDVVIENNFISGLHSDKWAGIHCLAVDGDINVKILNNEIKNNTCGIYFYAESGFEIHAEIHYNNITGNSAWGILNDCKSIINATYNYWGSNDGPRHNESGSGDNVSFNVIIYPWLFYKENKKPHVSITCPKNGVYLLNKKICRIKRTIIFGYVTVKINVTYDHGIDRIEIFVNNKKKCIIKSTPYEWLWNEKTIGRKEIKVIAYGTDGRISTDELNVFIVNLGLMKLYQMHNYQNLSFS